MPSTMDYLRLPRLDLRPRAMKASYRRWAKPRGFLFQPPPDGYCRRESLKAPRYSPSTIRMQGHVLNGGLPALFTSSTLLTSVMEAHTCPFLKPRD